MFPVLSEMCTVQWSLKVALTWNKARQAQVSLHPFHSLGSTEPVGAGTVANIGAMLGQGWVFPSWYSLPPW